MWWIELSARLTTIMAGQMRERWPSCARGVAAQSTVEYALVGALVVIAAATALTLLGNQLGSVFTHISDTLRTAQVAH